MQTLPSLSFVSVSKYGLTAGHVSRNALQLLCEKVKWINSSDFFSNPVFVPGRSSFPKQQLVIEPTEFRALRRLAGIAV